jgi:hypothetical protein
MLRFYLKALAAVICRESLRELFTTEFTEKK